MNRKVVATLVLLYTAILLATGMPARGRAESAERQLTLMIYMCGSNLESVSGSASADLQEILASGCDFSRTSVLVLAGGSLQWDIGLDVGKLTLLDMSRGALTIDRLEAQSMGSPETLSSFLQFGVQQYPAERYALIIWDHGGGPLDGMCLDECFDPDRLTLNELTEALDGSPFAREKLAWIGFDACLMGSVEVASRLASYADYMIASQAEEPSVGWDYGFLGGIGEDEDVPATGRRIVDMYHQAPLLTPFERTMACVDLSAVEEIEAGMDSMFGALCDSLDEESFPEISRLRFEATGFGKSISESLRTSGYDLVDVVSLSACYDSMDPDGAAAIRDAVERAVVYNRTDVQDSCGLSAYHPYRNKDSFRQGWRETYGELNFCPGYTSYVEAYGRIMAGVPLAKWDSLTEIEAFSQHAEGGAVASVISLKLSPAQAENLASARLVVLGRNIYDWQDDAFFRVYASADVSTEGGVITANYDGSSLQVLDAAGMGTLTDSISYSVTEYGDIIVELYPFDASGNRVEKPIYAEYAMDAYGKLSLKGYSVYDELLGTLSRRTETDLSRYEGITFQNDYRVPTVNENGETLAFDDWQPDAHEDTQWRARKDIGRTDFQLSFALAPSLTKDLWAAFELTDTQGNVYMSDRVPLDGGTEKIPATAYFSLDIPYIQAYFLPNWEEGYLVLALDIYNVCDVEQAYAVSDIRLNGVELVRANSALIGGTGAPGWEGGDPGLRPGEAGTLAVWLDRYVLEGLETGDTLHKLSGQMLVCSVGDDERSYLVDFAVKADIPLNVIFHDEDATTQTEGIIEDVQLIFPALDGNALSYNASVFVQKGEFADASRMIFNMVLENTGEEDITFSLSDFAINGVPVGISALNAEGTGSRTRYGAGSIAPGERSSASAVFRLKDLEALLPDVAVEEIDCLMMVSRANGESGSTRITLPLKYETDASLAAFCQEAWVLPEAMLVEEGQKLGALDEAGARRLFSAMDCDVYLQGFFLVGRDCVLLLRCENRSKQALALFLGNASMDGEPARMGRSVSPNVLGRNNQIRAQGTGAALWNEDTGVALRVEPGEIRTCYVSLRPESPEKNSVQVVRFDGYVYADESPEAWELVEGISMSTEEAGPLLEGMMAVAPAGDYAIDEGQTVETGIPPAVLNSTGAPSPARMPVSLSFSAPDGERMERCYYAILRRIRSEAELLEMNLLNTTSETTHAAMVSFREGRQWLLYELIGALDVSEDGSTASAVFPGLLPALQSEAGQLHLCVAQVSEGEDGQPVFTGTDALLFQSNAFPGAILNRTINGIRMEWASGSDPVKLTDFREGPEEGASLAEPDLVLEDAWLLPADANETELGSFVTDCSGGIKLYQMLPNCGEPLDPVMLPMEDPADYSVVYLYLNESGEYRCTLPVPLSDFVQQ